MKHPVFVVVSLVLTACDVGKIDTPVAFLDTSYGIMTLTFWRGMSDWQERAAVWQLPLRPPSCSESLALRLPLRRQILLPLLAIIAVVITGLSGAQVWLTTRLLQQTVDDQMRSVAKTLNASTFPLETNVLQQVRGLSGAELVIISPESDKVLAASSDLFGGSKRGRLPQSAQLPEQVTLREIVNIAGVPYYATAARLDRRASGGSEQRLEIYYPERTFRTARWQAIYPSMLVGGVALAFAVLLASVVSARVTKPVQRLKQQTEQIAAGDFAPMEPPARDDELRDLALAVNRMAQLLSASATQLRQHERAATLHQIGAGIAHQLRNAATGCRMAIDLFRRQHTQWRHEENLEIAGRQLAMMESYLQRFLVLGKSAHQLNTPVRLAEAVTSAVGLIRPLADHLHVAIEVDDLTKLCTVSGDRSALEQALVNLLTNGIEACAAAPRDDSVVRIQCEMNGARQRVLVSDNGGGFASHVRERLGEPFVTSKPEGTGLGLAVAKEIIVQHNGALRWSRADDWTTFEVELPAEGLLPSHASASSGKTGQGG